MEWIESAWKVIGDRIAEGPALAFLILTLVLISGPNLAERIRLPAMVGLVLAGMLVGPHGLHVLDTDRISLSAWGEFGLLYLMFAAGLELDLKMFKRMKKAGLTFAVLSFIIPFTLGVFGARMLDYKWEAAILMGSNWGSHTLVTYPMLRGMGLARNRAVGTVVAATAVTDTTALLVLTGVSASVKPSGSSIAVQGLEIVFGLAVLAAYTLLALPRITHWFFSKVGTQGSYRFVFGTVALLSGAIVAQAASIDGIVGAFFAGLGLIRSIPERSTLMERVQFFGSSLFIPIFLVSVGILLDPKVLIDPKTLLVALVFTIAVLGGKSLAAVIAGRTFHFDWPEIGVMCGLSGSQAAATLATTLVGARLGLFDKLTINAVLVVILASLIITPALVTFFGKKVARVAGENEAMGNMVLVPMQSEAACPLLGLAGRLAAADNGIVVAASIAKIDASDAEIAASHTLSGKAEQWLAKRGLESKCLVRVSTSYVMGLWETVRGEKASMLLTEWTKPDHKRVSEDDEGFRLLSHSPVPVVLTHGPVESYERVVVLEDEQVSADAVSADLHVAGEIASRLSDLRHPVTYVGSGQHAEGLFGPKVHVESVDTDDALAWASDHTTENDLVIVSGARSLRAALQRIPGFAESRFLAAFAGQETAVVRT